MSKLNNTYKQPKKDDRDYVFGVENISQGTASTLTSNRSKSSYQISVKRIEDQSSMSSCTAFTFTTCFEHLVFLLCQDSDFQASPLFNYRLSLDLDSADPETDPGTSLRSAVSNGLVCGVPRDSTWPYSRANFMIEPSQMAFDEAFMLSRMFTYFEVNRSRQVMKYILGDLNFMVMIGFAVYPSYDFQQVATSGDIPIPSTEEMQSESAAGHALNIVGWNDDKQAYIIANSYGVSWGKLGYGTLPYAYFENKDLVFEVKLLYPVNDFNGKYARFKNYCNQRDKGISKDKETPAPPIFESPIIYISVICLIVVTILIFVSFLQSRV